jgi:general secretion pathway protein D
MTGILLCLGLVATIRAQVPGASPGGARPERATLLAGAGSVDPPTMVADDAPLQSPAPLDPAVLPAQLRATAAEVGQPGSAGSDDPLPSVAPLPTVAPLRTVAQAAPPAGEANRTQPGAATTPSPPNAQPPARPQQRTPPARNPQQPPARPAADAAQQVQFGQDGLVTMHTNELDIRQLLELLSRRSGMNILVSPKVTGTITANFEGVTVEKVLNAIIKLADLVDKQEGAIHYILTKDEVQDEEEFTKKERILTKVYKLNYVRADEILGVIRPFLSPTVGQKRISVTPSYRFGISESATFVSGGGQAMSATGAGGGVAAAGGTGGPGGAPPTGGGPTIGGFQPPTGGNSLADYDHLIIQDYESNLQIIDQIIQRIDVRPIQVLIEAVIISVDYEHDRELGVNLGLVDNLGRDLGTFGSGSALNSNVGFNPTKLLTASGAIAQGAVVDPQGFTSSTNGVKFGFVSNNVTGFIRALETIGSTKILASPRILVLNKQRAEIQLGERLGFQTLSQNFTSTIQQVQFLNTGTLLRLRPFVSDDGMVRMEIHPERSSGVVTNNVPNQFTAELTTNVMVPDGATLVLGGLIEDEDDFSYQGLPLLSRLPALNLLTGVRQKTEGRRELVVLLTPHIWTPDQTMAHAPIPHPMPGAFGASGPVANASTTFDLDTGRMAAGAATGPGPAPVTGPSGIPASPAASAPTASPDVAGTPGVAAAGQPAMLASAATGPTGGANAAAGNLPHNDPATPQRRRSLRQWIMGRSRGRQADSSANQGVPVRPPTEYPHATGLLRPGSADVQRGGEATMPQAGVMTTPAVGPRTRPPVSSEQRPVPSGDGGANSDPAPSPPQPVDAARNERLPQRDPMVAQAGWSRARADETRVETGSAGEPLAAPETSAVSRESRPRGVVAGPRRHTIAPGETFTSIARRYYGSDQLAESLHEFNRGRIARGGPRPGDLLVIPPREELPSVGGWVAQAPSLPMFEPVRRNTTEETKASRPVRRGPRETATSPIDSAEFRSAPGANGARERSRAVFHVVGPSETPRSIARDRLGDARRAEEIVDLNHDLLAAEGRWKAGLRILLPPDAR